MTKGFSTSEFWLSFGGFAAGLALLVFGATQHDRELIEYGVFLMLGGSVPYAGVRAFVKAKTTNGIAAETQGRANDVLARMLDFAEQHVEKLIKPPEPVHIEAPDSFPIPPPEVTADLFTEAEFESYVSSVREARKRNNGGNDSGPVSPQSDPSIQ